MLGSLSPPRSPGKPKARAGDLETRATGALITAKGPKPLSAFPWPRTFQRGLWGNESGAALVTKCPLPWDTGTSWPSSVHGTREMFHALSCTEGVAGQPRWGLGFWGDSVDTRPFWIGPWQTRSAAWTGARGVRLLVVRGPGAQSGRDACPAPALACCQHR